MHFLDDIKKYGESRFRIAREVCETVVDSLNKMGEDSKHRFMELPPLFNPVVTSYSGTLKDKIYNECGIFCSLTKESSTYTCMDDFHCV